MTTATATTTRIFIQRPYTNLIILCITFTNYRHPRFQVSSSTATTITVHYPWAIGLLLGDAHLLELQRLDKPHLTIIRISVDGTSHSAISSLRYRVFQISTK